MPLPREQAISELYGEMLLVLLIGIAVFLIVGVSGGFVTMLLQKPPTFSVDARPVELVPGRNAISLVHGNGDPVALSGVPVPGSPPEVTFTLESPIHEKISVLPSDVMSGSPWAPGGTAILFYDGSSFRVTDDPQTLLEEHGGNAIRNMPSGTWLVFITDRSTRIVINSFSVTV